MIVNFLYCFDENYNIQALTSINSLLNNASRKINLHILHKDPESFKSATPVSVVRVEEVVASPPPTADDVTDEDDPPSPPPPPPPPPQEITRILIINTII